MPIGLSYFGDSLGRFGGVLQGIADRRRQGELRTELLRADNEIFSAYQLSRRLGRFNHQELSERYEAALQDIQTRHGVRPGEEALYEAARTEFGRIIEGELTRRELAKEQAAVVDEGIRANRAYLEALRRNPNMSLQNMDNLAGRISEGIVSIMDPTVGEETRARVYDRMLASARDLVNIREKNAAALAGMKLSLGVAEDIDRIETTLAGGVINPLEAINQASNLRERLMRLPVSKDTAQSREEVGNLIVRLARKAKERADSDGEMAARLYAEAEIDGIQRRFEGREITVDAALDEANNLRRRLMDMPVNQTTIKARDNVRNLITALTKDRIAGIDDAVEQNAIATREQFKLSVSAELDKIEAQLREGSITTSEAIGAIEAVNSSLEPLPGIASLRDQVRNTITRLKKEETAEREASIDNVIRLETQTLMGQVERLVAGKEITAAEGLAMMKDAEKQLAALPTDENTTALRAKMDMLITRLTQGKVEAAAEQEELEYTYARERVNNALTQAEAKTFSSEKELLVSMKKASDAIRSLSESTPGRIAVKSAFYKRILAIGGEFAEQARTQLAELRETSLTTEANSIEVDIRERRILSSAALTNRLNTIEKLLIDDDATEELKRQFSNKRVELKNLFETVLKNRTMQPLVDIIRAEVDALGPTADAAGVIELMNRRAGEMAAAQGFTPSETDLFRNTVFHQIRPEFAQATDNSYEREFVRLKNEIDHIFERANSAIELGGDFSVEQVSTDLETLFENVPTELQRDLQTNVIQDAANKLSAKAQDIALAEVRAQNKELIGDKIQEAGLDLRDNPSNLEDSWNEIRADIVATDLAPEDKEELMSETSETLLTQHIIGRVNDFLANPDNRDRMPEFTRQLKIEELYVGLDVDKIAEDAEKEWRREFAQQSRALIDQRLQVIELETDRDRYIVNRSPAFSVEDKARYNTAFEKANETRLAAVAFQEKVNNIGLVSPDDKDEYNHWYRFNDGRSLIRNEPASIIPTIAKAGFMTKEIVKDIWTTVASDTAENANQMLQTLSLIEGVNSLVLPASLSKAQHSQYTFWKYSRTNTETVDDLMTRVRAFNNEAQTAVRAARGTDYNRLASEAEYVSREELSDILEIEDALKDSIGIAYAHRDYLELHRMYYLNGMDWDNAEDAAAELVRRDWGKNTDGSLMYLPPESVGVPRLFSENGDFDHSWVGEQLQDDVLLLRAQHMIGATGIGPSNVLDIPEGAKLRLFADEQTRREKLAGRPVSYLIRYTRRDGVIDFLTNNNRLERFVPDAEAKQDGTSPSDRQLEIFIQYNNNFDDLPAVP